MKRHPYIDLPNQQFWKRDPGIKTPARLDPVTPPPFIIAKKDRIVTAGSCFAQHVARFMSNSGFRHHITEKSHALVPPNIAKRHNYGMFAARYGNIYTTRQLKQLLERAFGMFEPLETHWVAQDGDRVVDPFRPQIQPRGYASSAELAVDRDVHLTAVRRAVDEMDVFVFTLGLTEAWVDARDGAVFPLAPGVAGGTYDPQQVSFCNFGVEDVVEDLKAALKIVRDRNPKVKIILTVSPVPLNATFEPRHVLVSTVLSKAILRVAAETCANSLDDCVYFPSYDIITSPHVRGRYFAEDGREILDEGVQHVMRLFMRHFTAEHQSLPQGQANEETDMDQSADRAHLEDMQRAMDILCDEAAIDNE